jgi:hypothetical protein
MKVVVKLMGGMGNQMFQYAFGKRISFQTGRELILDLSFLNRRDLGPNFVYRNYDLDIFNLSEHKIVDNFNEKYELIVDDFDFKSKDLTPIDTIIEKCLNNKSENIYIDGYWSSPKYFSEIINSEFSFKDPIINESTSLIQDILSSNSVLLNIRRTDFLNGDFHGVFGKDYILNSINKLNKTEDNLKFFIFSDDIEWCNNNLHDIPNSVIVDHIHKGNKFSNYLQLMTNCKHFIIPNSTFAWWAAYLSQNQNKKVIHPEIWLKEFNATCDLLFYGLNWEF